MVVVWYRKEEERNGALGKKFDAYPQRQFVTESININSLTDHHIWSTIKTLPATLPEPRFKVRVSSAGVTGTVSQSDLDFCYGVGADNVARLLRVGPWLWDWRNNSIICVASQNIHMRLSRDHPPKHKRT